MKYKIPFLLNYFIKTRYFHTAALLSIPALLIWYGNDLFGGSVLRRNEVVAVVEKVGSTVVSLSTERLVVQRHKDPFFGFRSEFFNRFFNDYFGNFEQKKVEMPLGSGVIIDESGYIVTNEHVISRASKIKVMMSDETEFDATLVSADPVNDLAILKVDLPNPLPYIEMGISSDLMIGETVVALGNPFGLGNSVTTGVLSALHRTLNFGEGNINIEYKDLIQTDALINPGNSGGPLINIEGRLIGINTAILSQGQGIGFAIPVDKVKQILVNLLNFSEINKVWFGIKAKDADSSLGGIEVIEVEKDSPAQKAGLKEGDIITKLDNQNINSVLDYKKYILKKNVHDSVNLTLFRNMAERKATVILDKAPIPSGERLALDKLGIYVQQLTPSIANRLGVRLTRNGVLVSGVEKNSPAEMVQILAGYVIVRIGPYRITNMEELGIILNEARSGEILDIGLIWADAYGEHQGYARVKAR